MPRLYEKERPSINEDVFVETYEATSLGFNVKLLEYDLMGFIPLSGMVKKKKSKEFLKIGKKFFAIVTDVTNDSIDLDRLKCKNLDEQKSITRYENALKFQKIGNSIYTLMQKFNKEKNLDKPMYNDIMKYSIWNIFKDNIINDELYDTTIQNFYDCFDNDFYSDEFKTWGLKVMNNRINKTNYTIEFQFKIQCYAEDAVYKIKELLLSLPLKKNEKLFVEKPPYYKIIIDGLNKDAIIDRLNNLFDFMIENADSTTTLIEKHKIIDKQNKEHIYYVSKYPVTTFRYINDKNIASI